MNNTAYPIDNFHKIDSAILLRSTIDLKYLRMLIDLVFRQCMENGVP